MLTGSIKGGKAGFPPGSVKKPERGGERKERPQQVLCYKQGWDYKN